MSGAGAAATAVLATWAATQTSTSTMSATKMVAPGFATSSTTAPRAPRPDPLRYSLWASLFDGIWSIAVTAGWALSARSLDRPQPEGLAGLAAARVLYGTSWSVLIASEVALARLFAGDDWAGMSRGRFNDSWLVGFELPGDCTHGHHGRGPCGPGLGAFGEVSALIRGGAIPIRAALTGGWIQGRFDDDGTRTLVESTWVQSPIGLRAELPLALGPLALRLALGPGVYWGLHSAHVHPRSGHEADFDLPWHELIVLHGGAGPGAFAGASLSFFDTVSIEADADLAWMALGGSASHPPPVVAPLDAFRDRGTVLWRRASIGLGVAIDALRLVARY